MAFRQRTPTIRPQLSVRRVYETMQPRSEMKETPDAYLLHVYLPGFPRDSVKIIYVGSSRMVKVTGERPLQGNRWTRFDQTYPVPEDCDPESLQGKFELETLILTMPKKFTPQVDPKPEVQEKSPSEKASIEEAKPEKPQDITSQQPTTSRVEEPFDDKKSSSPQTSVKDLDATKVQTNEMPQKGHEEIEPKSTTPLETKIQNDEKPQKGHEEFDSKPTTTITTKVQTDEKPQKGQGEIEPKSTSKTLPSLEEELEEKKVEKSAEETNKERISKVEDIGKGKPSETRKPVKDMEKGSFKGKENRNFFLKAKKAEPSVPNKEKESIAEGKWNDEEKQLATNIGAAVLVIAALGAYVSYKFTS